MKYVTEIEDEERGKLELDKTTDCITLEEFNEMSLEEIVDYFVDYETIKKFCATLPKQFSKNKIITITDKDVINDFTRPIIKRNMLMYMMLPTETDSKDSATIESFRRFANTKPNNINIGLTIIRKKLNRKLDKYENINKCKNINK